MVKNWLLKNHVTFIEKDGVITFSDGNYTLHIPDAFNLDHELLLSHRIVKTDPLFLDKILLKLFSSDWLAIEIDDGIVLESFTLSLVHEILKGNHSENEVRLSEGLVIISEKDKMTVFAAKSKAKLVIKCEMFPLFLNGNLPETTKTILKFAGFYNIDQSMPELLSEAFHLSTETSDVLNDPYFIAPVPWKGSLSLESQNEFERVLRDRKSSYDLKTPLSIEELKSFLRVVFFPHGDSLAYPSAGKLYSAELKFVLPTGKVYSYDPLADFLMETGLEIQLARPECIRIFIVGTTEALEKKYRNISYRLLLLEAGVILQQLSLGASYLSYKGFINGMLDPMTKTGLLLSNNKKLIAEYRIGQ